MASAAPEPFIEGWPGPAVPTVPHGVFLDLVICPGPVLLLLFRSPSPLVSSISVKNHQTGAEHQHVPCVLAETGEWTVSGYCLHPQGATVQQVR